MTPNLNPSPELREARELLSDFEQMNDAQAGCVPCKLCGGKAVVTDAGTGAGYYVRCENSTNLRDYKGCMLDERRLSGWAYNVMEWWNRLHAIATLSPQTLPAPGEVERAALIATLADFHRIMTTKFDPTCMFGADYDRKMINNASKLVANLPAVIAALSTPTLATVAAANDEAWPSNAVHELGAWVQKKGRASWRGRVVGWYRTDITALGYAVESAYEPGSVQIYPETALLPLDPAAIRLLSQGAGK